VFGDSPNVKEETDIAPEDRIEEELAAALNPTNVEAESEAQSTENNALESTDAPDPEVAAVFGNIIDRAERLEEQYALDQLPTDGSEQSPNKSVTFVKASLSLKIQSLPILDNLVRKCFTCLVIVPC
jgi:protein TBF1